MREEPGVPFGNGIGRELRLDIYRPGETRSQRTAVLLFHGGRWRRGSRESVAQHARLLQAEGFTALGVEYRLLQESPWPAQIHDVKAAIRWVRSNAGRLGIEPERIALEGFSAGAHLSLLAAGTPGLPALSGDGGHPGADESVAAVAAFYAPTVFHTGETRTRGSLSPVALLGESPGPEDIALASPATHVTAAFPPASFFHGGADRVVPPSASIVMHDALRAAGVETDLHVYSGVNHAFDATDSFREVVQREVALFFRRMVSDRSGIGRELEEQSPFPPGATEPIVERI